MSAPTPPIAFAGAAPVEPRLARPVALPDGFASALRAEGIEVIDAPAVRAEASRDWWPLAMGWALEDATAGLAGIVVRPTSTHEVSTVARHCNDAGVPLTTAGGRSGVCGASVPLHGGVVLDTTAMAGLVEVDVTSAVAVMLPGTFGPDAEAALRAQGLTCGHWPQSMDLSTVGGWAACRGAGQLSTRYGKAEDLVAGLEVVLADGTVLVTGHAPRGATGPDLTHLFVGSEGTLGIITKVWWRCAPVPAAERRAAYTFPTMAAGYEACRRTLQRGATPAVLRLYDAAESQRSHGTDGSTCVLLVLDEGDPVVIDAAMAVTDDACRAAGAQPADVELVERWLHHRNDVSALEALVRRGFVVDTMEVAAPWSRLDAVTEATTAAMLAVPGTRAATCHLSHSYRDGACLYFTFAATPEPGERDATYVALWDAGTRAALAAGANLSHHHGVGLNRSRFLVDALGAPAHAALAAIKERLDPTGILNPGKLGFPDPYTKVAWPA